MNNILNDFNTWLMLTLAVLSVGDTVAGTLSALEKHTLKSAISKRGLLDKLKVYIALLTLWACVEIMSFAVDATELKLAMSGFVVIAIINEINSLAEIMGSNYTEAVHNFTNIIKKEGEKKDGSK